MMEPAVEMSPQSFVTKMLGSFVKLIVTRFVRFCPTWLRTCEVWPISLIFTVEEETLIFCAAPLTQPAKVTSMDESASQAPPSHSTSFFSSATINSQPLWLHYFPISFPLLFLSFPLQSLPVSSWFSPSSTLTPVSLSPPSHGDYISWNSERKDSILATAENLQRIQRWPRFSAHLLRSFLCPRRTSKSRGSSRGLVAWWTSEDSQTY